MKKQHWYLVWGFVAGTFLGGFVLGFAKKLTGSL